MIPVEVTPGAGSLTVNLYGTPQDRRVETETAPLSVDGKVLYTSTGKTGVKLPQKPVHLVIQQPIGPHDGVPPADGTTPAKVVLHVDWVRYRR